MVGKARMMITTKVLVERLQLPPDTDIQLVWQSGPEDQQRGIINLLVVHEDLPEVVEGAPLPIASPIWFSDPSGYRSVFQGWGYFERKHADVHRTEDNHNKSDG